MVLLVALVTTVYAVWAARTHLKAIDRTHSVVRPEGTVRSAGT